MRKSKNQTVFPMNTVDYQDLIINNPEKQVIWVRWGFHLLTLFFWAVWLYLWTPLPGLIKNLFLSDFSDISFRPSHYMVVIFTLLITLISWQIGWVAYNKKRFTDRRRAPKKGSLSNEELGQFFEIDNNKLEYWQHSKCLVMHHHDTGGIEEINVNDFFSFAPSLPKGEEVNQGFQRYFIILVPKQTNALLFINDSSNFESIMKVLCTVFKIRFVSCEQTKYNLYLAVDIPVGFKINALVKQLKLGSSSVINRKKTNQQEISESFWYSKHLVSKSQVPEQKIQNLVMKSIKTSLSKSINN